MGALGLGGYASSATLIPTAILILFCASQAVFFITARRTGDMRALAAAVLGVAVIITATVLQLHPVLRWTGVVLLISAAALNQWRARAE